MRAGTRSAERSAARRIAPAERAFDLAAIALLAPFLLVATVLVAAVVALDSPGSILYRARRVGLGGRPFAMLKFRTMRRNAAGASLTSAGDPRITPIGPFLRTSRLDELPQVWNVIRGEMRLVGPRPEDEGFVAAYRREYEEILSVPPGLTGQTQTRFAVEEAHLIADHDDPARYYVDSLMPHKVALDLEYARNHSLRGDLRILIATMLMPFGVARIRLQGFVDHHRPAVPAYTLSASAGVTVLASFLIASGPLT